MILDASTVMSDAQDITVTAASSNYIDTLAAGDAYKGAWLVVRVNTAFTASGSATLTFDVQTDDNSSFSSATSMHITSAIAKATLVAGYNAVRIRIPLTVERYIRVYYTVASGPMTAGRVDAFVTLDVDEKV
jgi:hypothetical protein